MFLKIFSGLVFSCLLLGNGFAMNEQDGNGQHLQDKREDLDKQIQIKDLPDEILETIMYCMADSKITVAGYLDLLKTKIAPVSKVWHKKVIFIFKDVKKKLEMLKSLYVSEDRQEIFTLQKIANDTAMLKFVGTVK